MGGLEAQEDERAGSPEKDEMVAGEAGKRACSPKSAWGPLPCSLVPISLVKAHKRAKGEGGAPGEGEFAAQSHDRAESPGWKGGLKALGLG